MNFFQKTKIIIPIFFFLIIFISFGFVYAQESLSLDNSSEGESEATTTEENGVVEEEIQPQDFEIKDPVILPDNPFYFFKDLGRKIRLAFTFNQIKKLELANKYSAEKLIELKKLIEKGKDKIAQREIENYKKEVERINEIAEKIKEKSDQNPELKEFMNKFVHQQVLHQEILERLKEKTSSEVYEKIKEARKEHLERFSKVMEKLENKERIPELLEKAVRIEGEQLREFKEIERLKRIREKMSEEVQEKIKEREEKMMEALKEKVERMPEKEQVRLKEYIEKMPSDENKKLEIIKELIPRLERPNLKNKMLEIRKKIEQREQEMKKEREEEGKKENNIQVCTTEWNPVCGKNGKTYSNECFAKMEGIEIDYQGECRGEEISDCAKAGESVNRNPLLGPTDKKCCPGLIEIRTSKSYSVCKEKIDNKEECLKIGGKWGMWGMRPIPECNPPALDAGKECSDSGECQGMCIYKKELSQKEKEQILTEGPISGKGECSAWQIVVGCHHFVEDGKIQPEICVD